MIAPRGLFIMGSPHINHLNPHSEHAAVLAGARVYEALGAPDDIAYVSTIADGATAPRSSPSMTRPFARA